MNVPEFPYYCSYEFFRQDFETGRPVLSYHKVGPAPAGDPGKVMYVGGALFGRHLRELKTAGFRTASMDDLIAGPGNPERRFVLTFDDGYENVFRNTLAPMAEHGFRAMQFLVAGRIGERNEWDLPLGGSPERLMDAGQVREWLAAGHQIGSHTLTHPRLCRIPRTQAREEITASKKGLEDRFGLPIDHFCYPYGEWDEAVRDLVADAGYRTACTTEPGLNDHTVPPFELRRLMACAPIRTPRQILLRLRARIRRVLPSVP